MNIIEREIFMKLCNELREDTPHVCIQPTEEQLTTHCPRWQFNSEAVFFYAGLNDSETLCFAHQDDIIDPRHSKLTNKLFFEWGRTGPGGVTHPLTAVEFAGDEGGEREAWRAYYAYLKELTGVNLSDE